MKVLLINGSPRSNGNTALGLQEMEKVFHDQAIETEIVHVGNKDVRGCISCGKCWELGKCVFDDIVNEVALKFEEADGIVLGSPVYYSGPNGTIISFADRLFFSTHYSKAMKVGAAITVARRGGNTATFDVLNKYFSINNMPIASSQYWNMMHGREAGEALQDEEGLQTMRTLALNMSFLIKSIALGKDKYGMPDYEQMPSIPLLAATFNDDLAYRYGCEMADCAHANGITGWYAPAMNIHRSAFSGRNFEYYSEDAVLSAGIASAETLGATDNGVIVFLKHFVLNDMESNRSNMLHTYSNEQAMREIYLKPFEECVKKGNANGIMSSMNYVGDVYSSAREDLCTEVLRNEWGFNGILVEDMPEGDYQITCADAAVRAGTDGWLGKTNLTFSTDSDADIYYLQNAAKHILQAESTAHLIPAAVKPWRIALYIIDLEILGFAMLGIVIRVKRQMAVRKK